MTIEILVVNYYSKRHLIKLQGYFVQLYLFWHSTHCLDVVVAQNTDNVMCFILILYPFVDYERQKGAQLTSPWRA